MATLCCYWDQSFQVEGFFPVILGKMFDLGEIVRKYNFVEKKIGEGCRGFNNLKSHLKFLFLKIHSILYYFFTI